MLIAPTKSRRPARLFALLLGFLFAFPVCASPEYFNRTAAQKENKPDEVIARLALRPGMRVADLGSGGGYYSLRFARAVGPDGFVYALDVNTEFLKFVERSAAKERLTNVKTVRAGPEDSGLADNSVDLIFVRNVFHHLRNRVAYLVKLRSKLRPGGRVVVVENAPGSSTLTGHATDAARIKEELKEAGFRLLAEEGFLLPKQCFLVFGL